MSTVISVYMDFSSGLALRRGFPADARVCLSDVVRWLLEQCGRPQAECRHKCMELFYELVPLLPGEPSEYGTVLCTVLYSVLYCTVLYFPHVVHGN